MGDHGFWVSSALKMPLLPWTHVSNSDILALAAAVLVDNMRDTVNLLLVWSERLIESSSVDLVEVSPSH